jgi:hypothetical protein
MSPTTAAAGFEDGSVDLLHLNSAHSYEEVKAAFRAWLPKLSRNGVALLHDVVPREYSSGLWKLWDEIARPGASFVFTFDGSLGVWRKRKGSERDPAWLRRLFGADDLERKRINDRQAIAASALALWHAGEESNSGTADPLQIRLVIDQEGGGTSWTKELAGEGLQSIRFERIGPAGSARRCTLQIDAVDRPVFITLFSITIARERDGAILYHGESVADFEEIQVRGGLLDQRESGTLQLLASGAESQIILPAIDLPQGDNYYLDVSLEPSRARFDHEISEIDVSALPTESVLRMDVFHSVAESYRDTECQTRYFARGCWQLLALDVPARDKISELPLRIDPVTAPAVIEVAQVRLTRPGTNEILWTAQTPEEFINFQVAGTASRLPHDNHLRILSFGDDPQLLLPSSTIALNNEPLRFEILLLVDPNGDTVRQCLASTKPRAGEATSEDVILYLELSADQEAAGDEGISLQAPLRMDERQIVRFENIESLSRGGDNRLKIGPLYRPAYLKISRIVITRDLDGLVLYRADSAEEFEKIELLESGMKQIVDGNLAVSGNGAEPFHVYLPLIDIPTEGSCRLEIEIEPWGAPAILGCRSETLQAEFDEIATAGDGWAARSGICKNSGR